MRFSLLLECVHRYHERLLADTLKDRLLIWITRILAVANLKNSDKYINSVVKYSNSILHDLSDLVFSDDEESSIKSFREEYEEYIKWVEEQERNKDKDEEQDNQDQ